MGASAAAVRCYGGIDAPPRAGPARPHGRSACREPEAHRRRLCRRRARGRRAGARARARDLGLPARGSAAAARVPARLPGRGGACSRPRSRCRSWSAARGSTATACATRRSCIAGGEILARYDKRELPNYGVFDEERTFSPGRGSLHIETPRRRALADDLRGRLAARRRRRGGGARSELRAQHLGLALPPRQGPGARGDARDARPRRPLRRRLLQPRRRPGRARVRRPQRRLRARRHACSRARRRSPRSCWSATSTSTPRCTSGCATRACAAAAATACTRP